METEESGTPSTQYRVLQVNRDTQRIAPTSPNQPDLSGEERVSFPPVKYKMNIKKSVCEKSQELCMYMSRNFIIKQSNNITMDNGDNNYVNVHAKSTLYIPIYVGETGLCWCIY